MSTALHVFRKDLSRHALWLVAWAIVCAGPLLVFAVPPDAIVTRAAVNSIAPLARLVVFLLLVQMVVHEDPLVDPSAFWLTRPIGGRALLVAKLLFVGVLLVLPAVVADVVQASWSGLARGQLVYAVPEVTLDWSCWALVMVALSAFASTTRELLGVVARVLLIWAAVVACFLVPQIREGRLSVIAVLWYLFTDQAGSPDEIYARLAAVEASRMLAASVAVMLAAAATAAVLYLTRRTRLGWATLAAGIALVVLTRATWRWNILPTSTTSAGIAAAPGLAQRLRVEIDGTGRPVTSSVQTQDGTKRDTTIGARIVREEIAPPLAAQVSRVSGSLRYADGASFTAGNATDYDGVGTWDPTVVQTVLGEARLVNVDQEGAAYTPIITIPTDAYERHAGQDAHLDITVDLALKRYRIASELPLRVGAAYGDDVARSVITAVVDKDDAIGVMLRDTQVTLLLAPRPSLHRRLMFFRFNPDLLYVLCNRRRGEAFWPKGGMVYGVGWPSRARIDESNMYASFTKSAPPAPELDADWLANADLVRLEAETLGTTTRRIVVPAFRP